MKISKIFFFLSTLLINEAVFSKNLNYTPPKEFKVYDENLALPAKNSTVKRNELNFKRDTKPDFENFKQIAINHLVKETGISEKELLVNDVLTDDKFVTVHLRQVYNGVKVNGVTANVSIDKSNGNVLLYASNLIPTTTTTTTTQNKNLLEKRKGNNNNDNDASSNKVKFLHSTNAKDGIEIAEAIKIFSKKYGYNINEKDLKIEPIKKNAKKLNCNVVKGLEFTHELQICKKVLPVKDHTFDYIYDISGNVDGNLYHVELSAATGEIYSENNLLRFSSFNAIPWYETDIKNGRKLMKDPEILKASPNGWNKIGNTVFYSTEGNNVKVVAARNDSSEYEFEENDNVLKTSIENELVFDYDYDAEVMTAEKNFEAAIANVFYMTNVLHDFYYNYGFDEQNGNHQKENFGKGGLEDDRLIVIVRKTLVGEGDFGNMMTYEDGQSAFMNLYVYKLDNENNKEINFGLSNVVLRHEYTHSVSDRLVGGPSDAYCLLDAEASAISEGTSEFYAYLLNIRKGDTRERDIRNGVYGEIYDDDYPYSTDLKKNPLMYSGLFFDTSYDTASPDGVRIWASILLEATWNVLDLHGITNNIILDPNSTEDADLSLESENLPGNVRMAKIVINAMKIMPCNPTVIEARNSIIIAQKMLWNDNKIDCALWKGFAKRGLGLNAMPPEIIEFEDDTKAYMYTDNFEIPDYCEDGEKPTEEVPTDEPTDEPTGEAPTDEPTGEAPTGEEPTGEEPTGEAPTGEEPTGEEPTGEEPTGEEPTGGKPTDEEPTGEKSDDDEPTGGKPTDEEPTGEKSDDDEPTDEEPTGEKSDDDEPTGEKSDDDEPTGEKSDDEKPIDEEPTGEKSDDEKPIDEKPTGEKSDDEKPIDEKPNDKKQDKKHRKKCHVIKN